VLVEQEVLGTMALEEEHTLEAEAAAHTMGQIIRV
jgi:hypothetical protein